MVWRGQFFHSANELWHGGLEGYFTLNVGTGGGVPTRLTAASSTTVIFTHPSFLGRIVFTGENLAVGTQTLPNGTKIPVLTRGTITGIDFLYNYRLSDAMDHGTAVTPFMQAAFLERSAKISITSLSASALTKAIMDSYKTGSVDPFVNFVSRDTADFVGTAGVNFLVGFEGNDRLRGLAGNDVLRGLGGNDILDGGAGSDAMDGGQGSDLYLPGPPATGTSVGDSVSDSGTRLGDIDTISYANATSGVVVDLYLQDGNQSAGWARGLMASGIERVIGSAFNDTLIGTDFPESINDTAADILIGGDGDDTLIGLGGSDILEGGEGIDRLYGGANGDIANPGPGDTARYAARRAEIDVFVIGGNVWVAAPGEGVDQLVGVEFIQTADGRFSLGSFALSKRQLLIGNGANNTLNGDGRDSLIFGGGGNDVLAGGGGADRLEGGAGNDVLNGGVGADVLMGGRGNDTYVVDNARDRVVEKAGGGIDHVRSTVSFTLSAHVENLTLTGSKSINGTGNGLSNKIVGNNGNNTLKGAGGNDDLHGGKGRDTLHGGAGKDKLYGGSGNDKLNGGAGADKLYGGSGNDTLKGGGGNDTLQGGKGRDTLDGGAGKDKLYGDAGADKLYGGSGNDTLTGGGGNDKLVGGKGRDKLYGGSGADDLYGGAGADTFIFKSVKDSKVAKSGRDTIYDFNGKGGDRIDLKAIDANTKVGGNQKFDFIGTDKFSKTAGELRYEKKKSDTYIYGDVNGDGKADFAIHLDDPLSLSKGYFLL